MSVLTTNKISLMSVSKQLLVFIIIEVALIGLYRLTRALDLSESYDHQKDPFWWAAMVFCGFLVIFARSIRCGDPTCKKSSIFTPTKFFGVTWPSDKCSECGREVTSFFNRKKK